MPQNFDHEFSRPANSALDAWMRDDAESSPAQIWSSRVETVHAVTNRESGQRAWLHCVLKLRPDQAKLLATHLIRLRGRKPPKPWFPVLQAGSDNGVVYYLTPESDGCPLSEHLRLNTEETTANQLALQAVQAVRSAMHQPDLRLQVQADGAVVISAPESGEPLVLFTSVLPAAGDKPWEKSAETGLWELITFIYGATGVPSALKRAWSQTSKLPLIQRLGAAESALRPPSLATAASARPESTLHRIKAVEAKAVNPIGLAPKSDDIVKQNAHGAGKKARWISGKAPQLRMGGMLGNRTDAILWTSAAVSLMVAGFIGYNPSRVGGLIDTEVAETLSVDDSSSAAYSFLTPHRKGGARPQTAPVPETRPSSSPPSLDQARNAFAAALADAGSGESILVAAIRLLRLAPDDSSARTTVEDLLHRQVTAFLGGSGESGPFDTANPSFQWQEVAQMGFKDAAILRAAELVDFDPEKAGLLAEETAKDGRASSLVFFGQFCAKGVGIKRDYSRALSLFQQAAALGDVGALYLVGECYYFGKGTPVDFKSAVNYLRRSATGGDPRAMDLLGNCYVRGDGVEKNPATAATWFKRAEDHGNVNALANLAVLQLNGDVPNAQPGETVRLLQKGAEAGHPFGTYLLALCYEKGLGVTENTADAKIYYARAAGMGQRMAVDWCNKHNVSFKSKDRALQ